MRLRAGAVVLAVVLPTVLAACGGGTATGSQPLVADHVHGVVAGSQSAEIVLATHYGLEQSEDAGATWQADNGLGEEMVAAIVKLPSDYVASLQPMAGMQMPRMTAANMSTPGMSMGAASTPNIGYSNNTHRWYSGQGIPPGAAVAALAAGSNGSTVWASLIGFGIYESTDAGRSWQRMIPAAVPVSDLLVVGANLLFATPSGLFVTDAAAPSMPGLPELSQPVNDMTTLPNCGSCVVAALGSGGVAASQSHLRRAQRPAGNERPVWHGALGRRCEPRGVAVHRWRYNLDQSAHSHSDRPPLRHARRGRTPTGDPGLPMGHQRLQLGR